MATTHFCTFVCPQTLKQDHNSDKDKKLTAALSYKSVESPLICAVAMHGRVDAPKVNLSEELAVLMGSDA